MDLTPVLNAIQSHRLVTEAIKSEIETPLNATFEIQECEVDASGRPVAIEYPLVGKPFQVLAKGIQALGASQSQIGKRSCDLFVSVPESWQAPAKSGIPQLSIMLRHLKDDNSLGRSIWTFNIPHPRLGLNASEINIPLHRKGSYYCYVELTDATKIWINASSKASAKTVCEAALGLVDSRYKPTLPRFEMGEKPGDWSDKQVKAVRGAFYPNGLKGLRPEIIYRLG